MGGTAEAQSVFEKGAGWIRRARGQLEAARRKREVRRVTRETMPGRRGATIARGWLEAEVAARMAVRSGVRADDYLRARLARYAAALPMPLDSLGIAVTFEDGEPVIRARSRGSAPPAPTPPARTAREVEEVRAEVRARAERVTTARGRLDAVQHAASEDLATGRLPGDPALLDASPEQRGRPLVPAIAPQVILGTLSAALLASAAYRLSAPAFALAGLAPDALAANLAHDAPSSAAALLFGLGAAVAVFAFLHVAAERGRELLLATAPAQRHSALAVAACAAVALAVAVALAAVRPGVLAGPVLLVTVPLGSVFLAREARRLAATRAEALTSALAWDREQARLAGERARRGEGISRLEAALAAALREHAEAERRLQDLERQLAEETREAAALTSSRALTGERLAESLASALELDRYAYLRRAAALRSAADVRPFRSRQATMERGPLEAAG